MFMIIVFIFGFITIYEIPKEEMPGIEFGAFNIVVTYPGVSPEEIEQNVVNKIEKQIQRMDGIDYISSTSQEAMATIYVQMEADADMERAWSDINAELDKVNDLPENANEPIVTEIKMREFNSIASVVISGDKDDNTLREISEDFEDALFKIPFISKVEISGTRDRQFWIQVDNDRLNQLGITYNEVANIISQTNANVPAGELDVGSSQYLVRTMGEYASVEEIANQVVRMNSDGSAIKVKDFAQVLDNLEDQETIGKYNGMQGINISVYMKGEGNIITVIEDVKELANRFQEDIDGIRVDVRNDGSIRVKNSIATLSTNALMGIVLVFIVLYIFLGFKNALYAAWGIPFSFLLTIIFMDYFGVTLNNLSLFGLILVLGMIVDDAIIVLENIHRYSEMGYTKYDAALKGTQEIMWPVIAAVATTVAAFAPMLFMEGNMGKFLGNFTIVVSLALTASLIECLLLLPSHVNEFGTANFVEGQDHKLHKALTLKYKKAISWVLKHRAISLSTAILALIASGGLLVAGAVGFEFFPKSTPKTLKIIIETEVGSSLDKTNQVVSKIEQGIITMKEKDDIEAIVSTIGSYRDRRITEQATNYASVSVDLVDADLLTNDYKSIRRRIMKILDSTDGLKLYKLKEAQGGGPRAEYDIELRLYGEDMKELDQLSNYLTGILDEIPGVEEIELGQADGKSEIRILPNKNALYINGLNEASISNTVATALYGRKISVFRGSGIEEYDIILKSDKEQLSKFSDLENLKIRNKNQQLIPLQDLASFNISQASSKIEHYDLERMYTITAQCGFYEENGVQRKRVPNEVTEILQGSRIKGTEGLLSNFSQENPGYRVELGGIQKQQDETYSSLGKAFGIALLLIFTILATQFKSYFKPLIVMSALPFAFIGVVFGLFITGNSFSMMTMIAVLALAGIVVNDSLVLVDFINKERFEGRDRWHSLVNAGAVRLRPIIMTTVTTIAGFLPMILSNSVATADWKPMATAIAFGLGFATVLTLFFVPVLYSIVDSITVRITGKGEKTKAKDVLN
jgi:multidrug efflux pump subunit AcrB